MLRRYVALLALTVLLGAACHSAPVLKVASPLNPSASPIIKSSATATPVLPPTRQPTTTSTPLPTATPTPAGIALPPGVIYRTPTGLWRVEADGQTTHLLELDPAIGLFDISPDGTQIVYSGSDRDIWLLDLRTSVRRNLTSSADRSECCPLWWGTGPDVVLISWPRGTDSTGMCVTGHPTVISTDGSHYRILDEKNRICSHALAPSPDGQSIAYQDNQGRIRRVHKNGRVEAFKPIVPGFSRPLVWSFTHSIWSPDSKRLAVEVMEGDYNRKPQAGFIVLEVKTHAARLLHSYQPAGGDSPTTLAWSPDGKWLALVVPDDDSEKMGLWIVRVDGEQTEKYHVAGGGSTPVWSPDSHWVVFVERFRRYDAWHAPLPLLIEVGTWQAQPLALPRGAEIIGWINPAQ